MRRKHVSKHVCTGDDLETSQCMQVRCISLNETEEFRETVGRIYGDYELRMLDVFNISHSDDRTCNILVEWDELNRGPIWEPAGDTYHDAPCSFREQFAEEGPGSNHEAGYG